MFCLLIYQFFLLSVLSSVSLDLFLFVLSPLLLFKWVRRLHCLWANIITVMWPFTQFISPSHKLCDYCDAKNSNFTSCLSALAYYEQYQYTTNILLVHTIMDGSIGPITALLFMLGSGRSLWATEGSILGWAFDRSSSSSPVLAEAVQEETIFLILVSDFCSSPENCEKRASMRVTKLNCITNSHKNLI